MSSIPDQAISFPTLRKFVRSSVAPQRPVAKSSEHQSASMHRLSSFAVRHVGTFLTVPLALIAVRTLLPDLTISACINLAAASAAMQLLMSGPLQISRLIAVPFSVIYVCQPSIAAIAIRSDFAALIPVLLLPAVILLAVRVKNAAPSWRIVAASAAIGVLWASYPKGSFVVIASIACLLVVRILENRASITSLKSVLQTFVLATVTAISVIQGVRLLANHWPSLGAPQETAVANSVNLTTILDPNAWLSGRLPMLPPEILSSSSTAYIGCSALVLMFIGLAGARSANRSLAAITLAAICVLWGRIGPESWHSQFRQLLEFLTVKRRVGPDTLNLVGLIAIPITALLGTMYFATVRVVSGTRRLSFWAVVLGAGVTAFFWSASPAAVGSSLGARLHTDASSIPSSGLLALAIIAAAACGVEQLRAYAKRRVQAFVIGLACITLVVADFRLWPMKQIVRPEVTESAHTQPER